MPTVFYVLAGAALTIATMASLGRLALKRLGLPLTREEQAPFMFLLGAPLLSLLVFLLAAAHWLYKGVFIAAAAGAIVAAWRLARPATVAEPFPRIPRRWFWPALLLMVVFGFISLVHAVGPEHSPDGSAYHLGVVAKYYRDRGFTRITNSMYANLSQGIEMLFLFAYGIGRHSAAAVTHLAFLAVLAAMMVSYGKRFGLPLAGLGAAVMVVSTPVVAIDAATAYIDVAVAAILFGVHYLLQIWDRDRRGSLLVAVGILAGFAYAAKYTAFLALPYAAGFILWRSRPQWRQAFRQVALVGAISLVWVLPWCVKNAVIVANPFSPFFNRLFPNPYIHISFEESYRERMVNYDGIKSRWEIPLELTVRGGNLHGLLGPAYLLAPFGLFALRSPAGRRLLAAAAIYALPYATNIGTRFLIPMLPLLAMAMALAASRFTPLLPLLVLGHAVSVWPAVIREYQGDWAWRIRRLEWRAALRLVDEAAYMAERSPGVVLALFLENNTPAGAHILSERQVSDAYLTRDITVGYMSALGEKAMSILWTPLSEASQPVRRHVFVFSPVEARRVRVRQTARAAAEQFTVTEMRVYSQGRELERLSRWRLRARPNPWDVQLAFDNNPVTRWASWEQMRPGMLIEIDFGALERIDSVAIESGWEQPSARLELDWEDGEGRRHTVTGPTEYEMARPLALRATASDTLKQMGFTHLLSVLGDIGYEDFHARREDWNWKLVAETPWARLYEFR